MQEVFKNPLGELAEFANARDCLAKRGKSSAWISGCLDSQKVHLLQSLRDVSDWQLVVTYDELRAKEIWEDYRLFEPEALLMPAKDVIFFQADLQSGYLTRQRMRVIQAMIEGRGGVIITTIDGVMNMLPPFDAVLQGVMTISGESSLNLEELAKKLVLLGYRRENQVEEPGQFAIRGGIADIFFATGDNPVRIELWGDEVDSIRSFDVESQRSIEQLEEVTIYPAAEICPDRKRREEGIAGIRRELENQRRSFRKNMLTEEAHRLTQEVEGFLERMDCGMEDGIDSYMGYFYEDTCSLLDYLPKKRLLVCLDEPDRLRARGEAVETEFCESMKHRLEKGYILPGQMDILFSFKEMLARLAKNDKVLVTSGLDYRAPYLPITGTERYHVDVQSIGSYQNNFEYLIRDLKGYQREGWRIVILTASRTRGERQASMLRDYEINAFYSEEARELLPGEICVVYGSLRKGFAYPMLRFAVLTESELSGDKKRKKRRKSQYKGTKLSDFAQLSVGDYVVHENYGLGVYQGIVNKTMDNEPKDYISILYGDGGTLYIPATQFHLIQKYGDAEVGRKPKLNKLGTQEWNKTKSRVKAAVSLVAQDLVELYAKRQKGRGFSYGKDTVWQAEFEELFPYEETQDQRDAIQATKADMESDRIMDRLICGDVGYGKTEIAIRAAFKAAMEGKQVVYLCPTTILAQQHYNTFTQRMKDFPVRVDLLCRFRTPAEQKKTLEDLKKGHVDVLIGTHRVLSKDVQYKDLGLLIIDEEQRFGVRHKEKIKQLKNNIDVLTLTATPIPRTLHMSMIGIRDMSVLEEAPSERVPIQTYVMEQNPEMVREAINREMARNGQVYYVYNRVSDIEEVTAKLAQLVPDAAVAYAHGQMEERRLEQIMLDFINGEIDVLVTTTIIETGLDISNVNTIIIHDADRFGLSQLYQLRGRVGRSNRTAYAFIMYRRNKMLSEVAEKRLGAIREYTELGSGIRIAMRDLEIRGAGSILGEQQHGHIEAVGYDLYCKMLNEAVTELKGGASSAPAVEFDTTIDLRISAYIPENYIMNESQKLDIYKRIASLETEDEISDMRDELIDRFGDLPRSVDHLLHISAIRGMAHQAYVTQVAGNVDMVQIHMHPKADVDVVKLMELLKKYPNQLTFNASSEEPCFTFINKKVTKNEQENLLESLKILLNDIKMLLES